MIGYFGPLVEPIKKRVRALHIFERRAMPEYEILPESATPEASSQVPGRDAVGDNASGTTPSRVCSRAVRTAREIALLGPSTPFLPEIFKLRGVTMLSGLEVVDPPQILRIVSEGGGTRQFTGAVRKLSLRC